MYRESKLKCRFCGAQPLGAASALDGELPVADIHLFGRDQPAP